MSDNLELPTSWLTTQLANVAEINPKTFCVLPSAANASVHFVPMSAVIEDFGGIDVTTLRPLREVQKGYTSFLHDDVLFAKITPCMENGKTAIVPNLEHQLAFGSTEFHVVRTEYGIHSKWLAYYISQQTFRRLARQHMTGSAGQLRVATNWLSQAEIPLAPTAEQSRVISKFEELLSELDAGVAELKAAQKKLHLYRQSLLKAAVEGSLTAEWRTRNTPQETGTELLASILKERRARWEKKQLAKFKEQGKTPPKGWQKKYPEPVAPDTTDLPELPAGWVWASVEQLGFIQLGRQRSPGKLGKPNPTPYIRAANITESGVDLTDVLEMDFSETEKLTFALTVGDILLTEASGSPEHVGRPAIWTHSDGLYCFQNTVIRFTPYGIDSKFAFYSFFGMQKLGIFNKISGGVGINHLSAGKFSKLSVALPSSIEQAEIIHVLKNALDACDKQYEMIAYSVKQSAAQRQNILRAAFAGELLPQDPSDEPANVILERIRAERATHDKSTAKRRGRKPKATA